MNLNTQKVHKKVKGAHLFAKTQNWSSVNEYFY